MTYSQAIGFCRTLLDESGTEYFEDSEIYEALKQSVIEKAREYYQRGERDPIRNLWTEEYISGQSAPLTNQPLNIEACMVAPRATSGIDALALYVEPQMFSHYEANRIPLSGRYEYTFIGNLIKHNAEGGARVGYYIFPTFPSMEANIPLSDYAHGAIIDRALSILYRKDVLQQDHAGFGGLYDIEQIITAGTKQ